MRRKCRLAGGLIGAFALVVSTLAASITAGAGGGPPTFTIGVDNATPTGHVFEYVDYFPRGQVLSADPQAIVGNGAVLDFHYGGGRDGLHTATFLPANGSPPPLVIPDLDNGESHLIFNPQAAFPTAGCGQSSDNACAYDGTNFVNSGAMPAFQSSDFFVQITVPLSSRPTTIHYVCLIHPGMQGVLTVVPGGGSSASRATFGSSAASQYSADTSDALNAESTATAEAQNGNFVVAGTATQFVEVAEMLPQTFTTHAGQTVTWKTLTMKDPHTVTFPQGSGSDSVDPLLPPYAPAECEGSPDSTPDTALAGPPPGFGCTTFPELGLNPAPNGVTAITDPTTVATSGIISSPFSPFPTSASFSFPNANTFHYQCRIHDDMIGTIVVTPNS
ncbi:MAG: hypothetical protein E6J01_15505 [Chloroflexi bacterium]|nr:MAG: hypothetical protein E6J01_15505 [Chloroflexota bacterium]